MNTMHDVRERSRKADADRFGHSVKTGLYGRKCLECGRETLTDTNGVRVHATEGDK